jgi:5'-nucleotidase
MKILLTNDDGFDAPGLRTLFDVFRSSPDVTDLIVAAPEKQQSCTGTSLTLHKPLRLSKVEDNYFRVNGSPADCVTLVCGLIKKDQIDLVVSGINDGPNLGTDLIYSGTVSAAIQASTMGIKAMAVSLGTFKPLNPNYRFVAETALAWAKKLRANSLPDRTFLNLNVPHIEPRIDGRPPSINTKVTKLGRRTYDFQLEARMDPRGQPYYWNCGKPIGHCEQKDTDCSSIDESCISVTPVQLDMTDHEALKIVSNW